LKPVDVALTTFVCSDVLAQCVVWVGRRYHESQQYDRLFSNAPARGKVAILNDRSGAFDLFFLRRLVQDSQPSIVFGYRPNPVSGQLASCAGVSVHTTYHDGYSVLSLTDGINAIINGLTLLEELSQLRARP